MRGTAAPAIAPSTEAPAPAKKEATFLFVLILSNRGAPMRTKIKDGAKATNAASSAPVSPRAL